MKISTNKEKLKVWLNKEMLKLKNHPRNNQRVKSYTRLIKESQGRFNTPNYIPRNNVKFSDNVNWLNFFGLANPIPLILLNENNRYLGHVWVNGIKAPNRSTGHFQGIQKTVNLNNYLATRNLPRTRVSPILLNAASKHLKNLGYNAMSTYNPVGKMRNILNTSPNWKRFNHSVYPVYKKNLR